MPLALSTYLEAPPRIPVNLVIAHPASGKPAITPPTPILIVRPALTGVTHLTTVVHVILPVTRTGVETKRQYHVIGRTHCESQRGVERDSVLHIL